MLQTHTRDLFPTCTRLWFVWPSVPTMSLTRSHQIPVLVSNTSRAGPTEPKLDWRRQGLAVSSPRRHPITSQMTVPQASMEQGLPLMATNRSHVLWGLGILLSLQAIHSPLPWSAAHVSLHQQLGRWLITATAMGPSQQLRLGQHSWFPREKNNRRKKSIFFVGDGRDLFSDLAGSGCKSKWGLRRLNWRGLFQATKRWNSQEWPWTILFQREQSVRKSALR